MLVGKSLSIIMPAIRPERWEGVVKSIEGAFTGIWELIIVSPYPLPDSLANDTRVKYVKDYGNPVRASNIGASLAECEFITWTADDAVYLPGSIDQMWQLYIDKKIFTLKDVVVVGKYYEGEDGTDKPLQADEYFKVNGSTSTRLPNIPDSYWLFNIGFMTTEFFNKLGYWDVAFEACPMAHTDMAIRAQRYYEPEVFMATDPILDCGHMPGTSGDHAPIHYAQLGHDEPYFLRKWADTVESSLLRTTEVKVTDWKNTPKIWERRFA